VSDTPQTDERTYSADCLGKTLVVNADWAQLLERENAALATMVDILRTTLWGTEFELEKTRKEIDALRADKERLDLLASRYWAVPVTKEYTDHIWMIDHDTPDLRAAIDARAKEGGAT
jgi:hypothetical protein